jgi:single-strand DNA-binding protein
MSYNRVILLGNITRDPQLSYLPSNTPVVEIGLAMNRKFKKQDGSQGEEVCYVDCKMFGKRAETINQYFKKGDPIHIEGRLKFESWKAQDGSNRSKLYVMIENFEFVSGKKDGGQQQNQQNQQQPPQNNNQGYTPPVDEIPF